jgi:hypothetical protein
MTLLLLLPMAAEGQTALPPTPTQSPVNAPSQSVPVDANATPLPDSPGSAQNASIGQNESQPDADTQAVPQPQPKGAIQKPLGTAAAGDITTNGVAASRPEGAALAPDKQKRVCLLIIKMGVVAAAAVAVGATVALSSASPGRPPGSH